MVHPLFPFDKQLIDYSRGVIAHSRQLLAATDVVLGRIGRRSISVDTPPEQVPADAAGGGSSAEPERVGLRD